jgi:transglutaminase-like putative cysteine protease
METTGKKISTNSLVSINEPHVVKDMKEYLTPSKYIDSNHPDIENLAIELASGASDTLAIAKSCFEYVRDEIRHSLDHNHGPVTCIASDVLKHKTGYCYAKSHLLAALLRANNIPAGLCYQRLTISDDQPPFCLHGLNAVYLDDFGWYRIDARGNKPGVEAVFTPPIEKLAYPIIVAGEADIPGIQAEPLPEVIYTLTHYTDVEEVARNLPDLTP